MRRKLLLVTMGLASTFWSAGCQNRPLQCADTCSSRELTCGCGNACCGQAHANAAAPRTIPLRASARRMPISRPGAAPMVIYDEPLVADVTTPGGVEWVETAPPPTGVAPRLPRSHQQVPANTGPQYEAPLPPPSFPDLLPAPARGSLQPSQFEEVIIRDVPADQMPVGQLPVGQLPSGSEGVPVLLPNGDQLIELGSKTISFGAGENYRTLTGEVQQFRRGWRLRYAAVDAEDAHGGSVSLVGQGLERLRDGVHVRVTGTLIPAEDRLSSPRFQVQALEMLEP